MNRCRTHVAIVAAAALLSACTPDGGNAISVDAVRRAAAEPNPAKCPIPLDVPAALKAAGVERPVEFGSADVETSSTTTPAADPLGAQQNGMSALDATAGSYIRCDYRVGGDTLAVRLAASPADAALNLLVPQIVRDARLRITDVQPLLTAPPGAGETKVVGGTVAVGGVAAEGGHAAVMVSSTVPELRDTALDEAAGALLGQIRF